MVACGEKLSHPVSRSLLFIFITLIPQFDIIFFSGVSMIFRLKSPFGLGVSMPASLYEYHERLMPPHSWFLVYYPIPNNKAQKSRQLSPNPLKKALRFRRIQHAGMFPGNFKSTIPTSGVGRFQAQLSPAVVFSVGGQTLSSW